MTRRELLRSPPSAPALAFGARPARGTATSGGLDATAFERAPWRATRRTALPRRRQFNSRAPGRAAAAASEITNTRLSRPRALKEVTLFTVEHALPAETPLYGEGFQMLSQTGGTVGGIVDLGNYTDVKHYRMPEPAGMRVVYNLLTLAIAERPPGAGVYVVRAIQRAVPITAGRASTSCSISKDARSIPASAGRLKSSRFSPARIARRCSPRSRRRLALHHKPLHFAAPPSGWCSWYCFGPKVTAKQVLDNLDVIARDIPGLRYIQIDDGYQPAMGDWLETGNAFGGQVQTVLKQIRDRGFEPAIWVAPFIAEEGSNLFKQHPEWFVTDDQGQPLRADRVTFGGWRRGPWYALDGTHPDAQAHLERVFTTMRNEWGCTYFKLDANFWGAIHGGQFRDRRATRIEAYRRGMAAVLRGTRDAFVLGCNHPIWPSIGLIHGSRSSHDIRRDWKRFSDTARQNLSRNWQNGRLWWNDPDAIVLTGELSEDEYRFHATVIYASGGMILSGDDLTTITPARLAMLRKLQPPTARAARFADVQMKIGEVDLDERRRAYCLLNWDDKPRELTIALTRASRVRELWSDEDLGMKSGRMSIAMPPRSGKVLICNA